MSERARGSAEATVPDHFWSAADAAVVRFYFEIAWHRGYAACQGDARRRQGRRGLPKERIR